jgi:hypothetical protein
MTKDPFDFTTWISESVSLASLEVIKKAVLTLEKLGNSAISNSTLAKHIFYISFVTKDKASVLPDFLLSDYPDVITIVLENQFENLRSTQEGFFVSLSFNNKLYDLFVPFKAIVNFSDKSLNLNMPVIYDTKRLKEEHKKSSKKDVPFDKKPSKNSDSNVIQFKRD